MWLLQVFSLAWTPPSNNVEERRYGKASNTHTHTHTLLTYASLWGTSIVFPNSPLLFLYSIYCVPSPHRLCTRFSLWGTKSTRDRVVGYLLSPLFLFVISTPQVHIWKSKHPLHIYTHPRAHPPTHVHVLVLDLSPGHVHFLPYDRGHLYICWQDVRLWMGIANHIP